MNTLNPPKHTNVCDWAWWHLGVSAIVAVVLLVIGMLTQDKWSPFDKVIATTASISGGNHVAVYRLEVFDRYPVSFTRRLVHMESGVNTDPTRHTAATGRVGIFSLSIITPLPDNAPDGTWCLFIEGTINYNVLLSAKSRPYEPVCASKP